jgi:hypothetical protein
MVCAGLRSTRGRAAKKNTMKHLKDLKLKDLENKLYIACNSIGKDKSDVESDFMLDGDINVLKAAMLIQMWRHPFFAAIINKCCADYEMGKGCE